MDALLFSIRTLIQEYKSVAIEMRRHLHAHPELSGEEKETAAFIAKKLSEHHIPFLSNIGGNGIIAFIKGKNPEQVVVALRADMDALNITEAANLPFASGKKGIMHACGHDFHVANLLTTAFVLNRLKEEAFSGTVMLIFQPSEEKIPSGAEGMIKAGIFRQIKPKAIFALHVDPEIPTGQIGTREGPFLAAADELFITVHGKGGHGAYPQNCIDPIVISAQIILALQTIISRNANPANPTVINIGRVEGAGRTNIIPDTVHLDGTIRTFDEEWRKTVHQRITELAHNTAKAFGGDAIVEIKSGYPPLVNDKSLTNFCIEKLSKVFGKESITECPMKMGAEDFSFFAREIPATFFRLGIRNEEKNIISPLHTSTFDLDEDAFDHGITALAYLAVCALQ